MNFLLNSIDTPTNDFKGQNAIVEINNGLNGGSIILGIIIGLVLAFFIYKVYKYLKNSNQDKNDDGKSE